MSDYISRQAAIDAIEEIRSCIWDVDIPSPTVPEYIEHHKQMQELMDRCDTLRSNLVNLQSAEPERPKGEWVLQSDDYHEYYECDQCGIAVGLDDVRNYCPNCGAEMERRTDE